MAIAGTLELQMVANLARLSGDMQKAQTTVGRAMGRVEQSVNMAKRALGALGLGIGAVAFGRLIKGALDAQDELSKLSQKLNISVEGLVGLQHAASMSGLSFENLQKAIKTVSTQMFDASMGLLESQRNFRALGIEIKGTDGSLKSAEAVIVEIADKFAAMGANTEKTALAVKLFGRAGLDMIPMLNMGSAALAKMVAEGQALNPVTAESARQAELFNDSVEVLTKNLGSYGVRILNDVLPVMSELVEMFSEQALAGAIKRSKEEAVGLDNSFKILPETFKVLTILGGNVSFVLQGIGRDLGGMAAQLAALARGDFGGFSAIRKALVEDGKKAREELDAWEKRVMALGTAAAGGAAGGSGAGGAGTPVDDVAAEAAEKARQKEMEWLGKALQDGLDEERRIQQEANDAVVFWSNKRLEDEKQLQADLQAAKIAGYEWEQEQAIAAGEAEIAIAKAIAEAKATEQAKTLSQTHTFLGAMSGLMNTESKKQFKIGKAAAAAETAINTYAAAMGAYKALASIPFVGPALGAAAAAAIALTGAAQIQKINAMEIGGGSGAVGTFPASPTTGQPVGTPGGGGNAARGQTSIVNLYGESYSRKQVRELLESVNENSADGGRVVVVER